MFPQYLPFSHGYLDVFICSLQTHCVTKISRLVSRGINKDDVETQRHIYLLGCPFNRIMRAGAGRISAGTQVHLNLHMLAMIAVNCKITSISSVRTVKNYFNDRSIEHIITCHKQTVNVKKHQCAGDKKILKYCHVYYKCNNRLYINRSHIINMKLWLCLIVSVLCYVPSIECLDQIVYAINCGGEAHTDSHGIRYDRDPLHGKIGIASDYGKRLLIGRIPPSDHILYQTERYHTNTFGYDIPVNSDGEYVLVLKFCEVYFNAPNQKVFDVVLNGDHTIVSDLDIFEKVGRGVAHDEYIPFKISKGRLIYGNEESEIRGAKIRVEFIKGYKDNPKINAMYVMRGKIEEVPKLPPTPVEPDPIEEYKEEPEVIPKNLRPSGPKQPDPYAMDDSSIMLPVFIAIGAFIPLLFCLCKL